MRLLFLSNFYNHHQAPICGAWNELTNGSFRFVPTEIFSAERRAMGWDAGLNAPFVIPYGDASDDEIELLAEEADSVIFGSAPMALVVSRLKKGGVVFKYSERLYKQGYDHRKWFPRLFTFWRNYGRHRSLYLLAASAYTAADFAKHGTFIGKAYQWGYFPECKYYDIDELLAQKKTRRILWCGRFLSWKHPDAAIEVAERLKAAGYDFGLYMIGGGEMDATLRRTVQEKDLSDYVHLLGTMAPEQVREQMEQAGIFLFTSDFNEGWGAVLNEAMNSGCAVVASHAIGSVPFLMENKQNGLVYLNGNTEDIFQKLIYLLEHPDEQARLGRNAYSTIVEKWNAQTAAERFLRLDKEIRDHGYCDLFEDGPCSRARILKNNWFSEHQ